MSENKVINLDSAKENTNTETNNDTQPQEMSMLEYVNSHFKGIHEAINDTRRLISMIDKLCFKEMCKSEAIVALITEKCNITEEELIKKFQEIVKEYQENVDNMREMEEKALETQPKDLKNLTEEEAEEIRNKIKADVELEDVEESANPS